MRYLVILIFFMGLGCAKERSCENCRGTVPADSTYKNATVVYAGPVETDGCGWLIEIDNLRYHPDVLNIAFQQNQLPVKIDCEVTSDKFTCGVANLQITVIHVNDIKL